LHKLVVERLHLNAERLISLGAAPNRLDIAADTSSAAAGITAVVGLAAAAPAAPIVAPMRAKSDAATATVSGAAITNDV
jgi:hypothetical protein